jgi:hypothetical protein
LDDENGSNREIQMTPTLRAKAIRTANGKFCFMDFEGTWFSSDENTTADVGNWTEDLVRTAEGDVDESCHLVDVCVVDASLFRLFEEVELHTRNLYVNTSEAMTNLQTCLLKIDSLRSEKETT